ncbi:hypothetical protein LTR85_009643 [Meristemomyces frigidus]|nr:hypothetical protein LTR85_009643 [Meristemomyces frigidus]
MTEPSFGSEAPQCTNSPPTTPTTPGTLASIASTAVNSDPEKRAQTPCVATEQASQDGLTLFVLDERDPESLQKLPKRATFSESLKRAGTSLSGRIPVHWRANYLSEGRNSQRIDDHPDGYPRFAAFMNSDENFLIARRYGLLHTRVMLYRQAELADLERDLLALDEEDAEEGDRALKGADFLPHGERGDYRMELIAKIEEKLRQYDDIVMRHRAMSALPSASNRNYASVGNYLHHNATLSKGDQALFKEDTDFAALVDPKEAVSLDGFIEDCLSMVPCKATKLLFSTPEQRVSTDDKLVHLYSKSRIDFFVRLLITVLAVTLLMAPVVVLFRAEESGGVKILIILLFTLFFSVALSIFTKAQRHEVFAATAA